MIEIKDTYYDPATDGFSAIAPGNYPAHVISFEARGKNKKGENFANNSKVFNLTFQIADEAAKLSIPKVVSNGEGQYVPVTNDKGETVQIKAIHAVGKRYKSQGVWLTPSPPSGQGWKNGKYKEFFESIGVEFPEVEGKTKLMEVEEDDVIGSPCLVRLGEDTYERDGEKKVTLKVFGAYPWNDGVKMSPEEVGSDVPF